MKWAFRLFRMIRAGTGTNVYLQSDQTQFLKYEGPVDPTITGGFTNTFFYKNFSLSVHLSYQAGNKIRLRPSFKTEYSDLDALTKRFQEQVDVTRRRTDDDLFHRSPTVIMLSISTVRKLIRIIIITIPMREW